MTYLTATQLSTALGVSKGRVSQYVSAGQLEGCYQGEGRFRRFDLNLCKKALSTGLHAGQMMGNGSDTKKALQRIAADGSPVTSFDVKYISDEHDPYEQAKIESAQQDARSKRLKNEREEGNFVLASEVRSEVQRQIASELKQFEAVINKIARGVADKMGVDFLKAKSIMMDIYRDHRQSRSEQIEDLAEASEMTACEVEADV